MDPEKMIYDISTQINTALEQMAKAEDVNEKETYSRVVKNLCESLNVFFSLATDMMPYDYDDDFDDIDNDEDLPF